MLKINAFFFAGNPQPNERAVHLRIANAGEDERMRLWRMKCVPEGKKVQMHSYIVNKNSSAINWRRPTFAGPG